MHALVNTTDHTVIQTKVFEESAPVLEGKPNLVWLPVIDGGVQTKDWQILLGQAYQINADNVTVVYSYQDNTAAYQGRLLAEMAGWFIAQSQAGAVFNIGGANRPLATDLQGIAHINAEVTAISIAVRQDGEFFYFEDSPVGVALTNAQMTALAVAARAYVKKCVIASNQVIADFFTKLTGADMKAFDYKTDFATKMAAL